MKNKVLVLCILIIVMGNLIGCNMPLPTCSTDSLQEVTLLSPAQVSVIDTLSPTLEWSYPSSECAPEGYAITMWEGPVMTENIGGGTGNPTTKWGPGSPLEPGKQYRWNVAPINGTTLGPVSDTFIFFTGPVCTDASLVPPTMLEPADGAIFNPTTDMLWWDYTAGCTPTGYQLDVATDSSFTSGLYPSGVIDIPLTRAVLGDPPLVECETYYWRVAARNGDTIGSFSPTRSFVADSTGACGGGGGGGTPPDSASISGIVWHDICALPDGPLPDPLSVGCVEDGSGSAHANGIREEGEPGIAGVQVDLYYGGCDIGGTIDASVLTDADGRYIFDGLTSFGEFCVAINPTVSPNDSILLPGQWTYPDLITDAGVAYQTFGGIESGVHVDIIDFGWDYQLLPVFNDPTPTPVAGVKVTNIPNFVDDSGFNTPLPQFIFEKNAFCRKGPSINYSDVTAISAGDTVQIQGVSSDRLWYRIFWAKFNVNCWVAGSTGRVVGDVQSIPVMTPPPTVVPSVVPSSVPSNNNKNNTPTPVPSVTPVKP
ncbi:MAG: SdrD B-like domain-containing protein [Anaerolineales bacterium]